MDDDGHCLEATFGDLTLSASRGGHFTRVMFEVGSPLCRLSAHRIFVEAPPGKPKTGLSIKHQPGQGRRYPRRLPDPLSSKGRDLK